MKIIELALLREPCLTTGPSGGTDSVTVCHGGCCWRSETADTTETAVLVSTGLDYFNEGISTSLPNNLCVGLYSVLT